MKTAIVFDDLIQFGGAERLLLAIHELYPNAPVYTSAASGEWVKKCADNGINLKTSFMQKLPFKKSLNRFYGLLGLHALAFESFEFDNFDVVLSISARFAHGVLTKPGTIHVCYMNSPGRMFWEPWDYFERENFLQNDNLKRIFWLLISPFLSLLRLWDFTAAQRIDHFIANSKTPQNRIKKYYRRDSTIIYPFVDDGIIRQTITTMTSDSAVRRRRTRTHREDGGIVEQKPYYLIITRLQPWKRVDIAIDACKKAGVNLKIIGEGSDRRRLEGLLRPSRRTRNDEYVIVNEVKQSNDRIKFLGYVREQEKYRAIANCMALIVTQKEDFGITALEATSLGKPVIAYRAGGALETVVDGVTGEFFDTQNAESLAQKLSSLNTSHYRIEDCKAQAAKFSKQKFIKELDDFIKNVYHRQNSLL